MKIYGSKPRTFPSNGPRSHATLIEVYGDRYEGIEQTVPDGEVLIVPEHGDWETPGTTFHEFLTGTRFLVVRAGDPRTLAITEILTSS